MKVYTKDGEPREMFTQKLHILKQSLHGLAPRCAGTMIECASNIGVMPLITPHIVPDVMDDVEYDIN